MPRRRWRSRTSSRIRSRSLASRLDSGSSSRSSRGRRTSARARARRCCCPPESCEAGRDAYEASCTSASTSSTRCCDLHLRRPSACPRAAGRRRSRTRSCGARWRSSGTPCRCPGAPAARTPARRATVTPASSMRAGVRPLQARDAAQGRRLAAAGRSQERVEVAFLDVEADAVHRPVPAMIERIVLDQTLDHERAREHAPGLRTGRWTGSTSPTFGPPRLDITPSRAYCRGQTGNKIANLVSAAADAVDEKRAAAGSRGGTGSWHSA